MCGITGVYCFGNISSILYKNQVEQAVNSLNKRGPDANGTYFNSSIGLGHTRLSIIDISSFANQPFVDQSGRYSLVFNGEIFNYKELRENLTFAGEVFETTSDTEVLFKMLINEGSNCLNKLNGFFAFAFYDNESNELLLARDRFGVKPLLYFQDNEKLIFGSEMKALFAFGIPKNLDHISLNFYLQLNYLPGQMSMIEGVEKLQPGSFMKISQTGIVNEHFYDLPEPFISNYKDYEDSKLKLVDLLEDAVQIRLEADVPVGLFLSGGIDSSVITALASRHSNHIKTFSIGYKDNPYFDETSYAELVAKKYKTDHTVFKLNSQDLLADLDEMLDYVDEPFADSSALAVYVLSKRTRKQVKVALSGDGADEIFSGYNKHQAEWNIKNNWKLNVAASFLEPFLNVLPKSRNNTFSDFFRKIEKFTRGKNLSDSERYWFWCSIANETEVNKLLINKKLGHDYGSRKAELLTNFNMGESIDAVLRSDVNLVLPNDMLVKVDMMSMANGLEVRTPFLDYRVVDFAFSLPESFKINGKMKKRIVQDAFRDILPNELYNRPKHGFEIPLLDWLRTDLKNMLNELLDDDFIISQNIFQLNEIKKLKLKLFSNNPEDSPARIWALIIFQHWWKRFL